MRRVFVDSGGFFATLAPKDTHHQRAKRLFLQADYEGWSLVTTNAVVFEAHALIINRTARGSALGLAFLDQVATGLCEVERVRRRTSGRPSICSAPIMTRVTRCATRSASW